MRLFIKDVITDHACSEVKCSSLFETILQTAHCNFAEWSVTLCELFIHHSCNFEQTLTATLRTTHSHFANCLLQTETASTSLNFIAWCKQRCTESEHNEQQQQVLAATARWERPAWSPCSLKLATLPSYETLYCSARMSSIASLDGVSGSESLQSS